MTGSDWLLALLFAGVALLVGVGVDNLRGHMRRIRLHDRATCPVCAQQEPPT